MATRFYLPSSGTPSVSPAFQSYTHAGSPQPRRDLPTSNASTLSTAVQTPDGADHLVAGDTFHSQFISAPLAAQTFTSGDAFKYCVQATEANAGNNLFVQVWMGIYTNDGATLQATIRSKVIDDFEIATGSVASRFQSSTLSGTYTCANGERLVLEISVSGTATAAGSVQGHNASIRWGANAAGGDLLESDGQTGTTLRGWIEFTNTVIFPTRGLLSWAEFETPNVPPTPTRGLLSWAELEVPFVPTRGLLSWAEFEVPLAATRGLVSWAEFEVPAAAASPTRGLLAWAELEVPLVPTRGLLSWAELEVPTGGATPTRGRLSWIELQVPSLYGHDFEDDAAEKRAAICWNDTAGQPSEEYIHVGEDADGKWTYRKSGSWLSLEKR